MAMKQLPLAFAVVATVSLAACVPLPPEVPAEAPSVAAEPDPATTAEPSDVGAAPSAASDEPQPGPAAGEDGSRDNPFLAGEQLESDEWSIVVGPTDLDANEEVAAGNMFNEPPAAGHQYIRVPITVSYRGTEAATTMDVGIAYVAESGETYETYDTSVSADDSNPYQELYEGGTASYYEYLMVPSEGIEDGLIRVTAGLFDGAEAFVALQ